MLGWADAHFLWRHDVVAGLCLQLVVQSTRICNASDQAGICNASDLGGICNERDHAAAVSGSYFTATIQSTLLYCIEGLGACLDGRESCVLM